MENRIVSSIPSASLATILWPPPPPVPRNVKCSNGGSNTLSSGCRSSYVTLTCTVLKYRMVTTVTSPLSPVCCQSSIVHPFAEAGVLVGPPSDTTNGAAVLPGTIVSTPPQATAPARTAVNTTRFNRVRSTVLYSGSRAHFVQEILQQVLPIWSQDGLRVELDSLNGKFLVPQTHD